MSNQELRNRLEYYKGGLELIEKELEKTRGEILRGLDLDNNSKKLSKIMADYIIVKHGIEIIERAMNS